MSVGIVDILKKVEGDLGVPVSMVRSEVTASGLEIFQYEPRARVKIGDANLVSGMLTRHPDGTVQFLGFYVNDTALADLPAARRLIAEMVASLTLGARLLPSGARVQLAGNLVLDPRPSPNAQKPALFGVDTSWYVWEGSPNPANVRLLRQEAHVRMPGGRLIRHVFFYASTQTESVDFQRIAESATLP